MSERYPERIEDLCKAILAGEDCWFALHDALIEAGYPTIAIAHYTFAHGRMCRQTPFGCSLISQEQSLEDIERWSKNCLPKNAIASI